ncbi:MAG TPA: hypothetical protein VFX51_09695 [Solirubrobacteraceae bacterium]|nr:hypothetical protein [Solirubrobacteraceae bacterium]
MISDDTSPGPAAGAARAARLALAGALVAFAFCGLFVTAFHAPSPHAIPIGTVGAASAPAGFAPRHYDSEQAARADLESGEVRGVLLPGRLLVASARGAVEAQFVRAAFPRAAVTDVAPLPEHDSRGLSAVFTALGVTVAGVAFGALLTLFGTGRRVLAIALFGGATGLVVALTVDTLVGALTGAFWATAGIAALSAAAISAATHAIGRAVGPPGLAVAALLFIPLGQSAAGGALGSDLVPSFFGALSDALPVGASQSALRGAVYFDGAGTTVPLLVLAAWAAVGAAVVLRFERT